MMYNASRHLKEFKKLWNKRHRKITVPHAVLKGDTYAERSISRLWYLPKPLAVFVNVLSGSYNLSNIRVDVSTREFKVYVHIMTVLFTWSKTIVGEEPEPGWEGYFWFLVNGKPKRKSEGINAVNITVSPFKDMLKLLYVDGHILLSDYDGYLEDAKRLDTQFNAGELNMLGGIIRRAHPSLWDKSANQKMMTDYEVLIADEGHIWR